METVANIAGTVAAAAAIIGVFFALSSMLGILRLAPKGKRLRVYNQLSMWKFAEIRTEIGQSAERHLRVLRRIGYGSVIFIGAVILLAISGIVAGTIPGNANAN